MYDESSTAGWDRLRRLLERQLGSLPVGWFVIAERTDSSPDVIYVQAARDADCLWCEAVGPTNRAVGVRPPSPSALLAAGWSLADEEHVNHWAEIAGPAAEPIAAELLVCTLKSLYKVDDSRHVEVTVGQFPEPPDGGLHLRQAS